MLADLCLPLDELDLAVHRDRVAALVARGFDVIAAVHSVVGRLTQADKCSITPLSAAALAAASSETRNTLALRSGSTTATLTLPPGVPANPTPNTNTAAAAGEGDSAGRSALQQPARRAQQQQQQQPGLGCALRQLTRLHVTPADTVQAAQLTGGDDVLRSYDIVSIAPKNERVLLQACTVLDVDIISLELSQRMAFKLRANAVKAAIKRGIFFEICYAPGLREATARRNLFCNAQAVVRMTRGKNILLSSSARSAFEVRSPLELLHMALLFGLTRRQAQDAIKLAPRAVLARAAARLAGKGAKVVAGSTGGPAEGGLTPEAALAAAAALATGGDAAGPAAVDCGEDVQMDDVATVAGEVESSAGGRDLASPQQQQAEGGPGQAPRSPQLRQQAAPQQGGMAQRSAPRGGGAKAVATRKRGAGAR